MSSSPITALFRMSLFYQHRSAVQLAIGAFRPGCRTPCEMKIRSQHSIALFARAAGTRTLGVPPDLFRQHHNGGSWKFSDLTFVKHIL